MASLSATLEEIRNFEIPKPLPRERPVIVYGAGGFGRDVVRSLVEQGYAVVGFLDRHGPKEIASIPCRSPDADLKDWLALDATVLLGLHNFKVDPLPIRQELLALGFRRVLLPVEYFETVEKQLGVRYWLGKRSVYPPHLVEIEAFHALLTDDKSRALLLSTLEYRALGLAEAQPVAQPEESYFPKDIPQWSQTLNWVDGGACDGDSLRAFPLDRYRCDNIYAFEPDPANFEKLQVASGEFQERSPHTRIKSWATGLGREDGTLTFKTGLGTGSGVSADGDMECSIVRLDSVLAGSPVNLIKIDIEGAEPDALIGAEQIIREQKPGLAVCIYHTPEHLWEIPLLLEQKYPGYRLYLRCHGHSSFDLVLYALPT